MRRLLSLVVLLLPLTTTVHGAEAPIDTLGFEVRRGDGFAGWGGGPRETQFADSVVVRGGRYSIRMERGPSSPSSFSTVTRGIPVTFQGKRIELRGWLKLKDVKNGFAGLWLREDGKQKPTLHFDNMKDRNLNGTMDWTEYSIELPFDIEARTLVFGALISGEGTLWADDLRLFVDGRPLAEAPPREFPVTAIDRDHEFDAGSKITATSLTKVQTENLVLLGKVWGFVKYHHPRIAAGEVSWDYELFRVAPGVMMAATDAKGAQAVISAWLDRVGLPSACTSCAAASDSLHLEPEIQWIHNRKMLGAPLQDRLEAIYTNRGVAPVQHYVSFVRGDRNPVFENERAYATSAYPDPGYRLLALFRFWNVIEYWFPYRNLIDENWDGVLKEFVPRVMAAADANEYALTMMELAARTDDGHAGIPQAWQQRPPAGECRLPVAFRYVQKQFVVSEPIDSLLASQGGLEVGDVLSSIDGKAVATLVKSISPYYAASNPEARMWMISYTLSNGACGPCKLEVKRGGKTVAVTSERKPVSMMMKWDGGPHDLPGDAFQKLSDDVAYLKLSGVVAAETASYIERAAGTKCLIIDIRNYPNEFVPFALGQHLVTKSTPFACFTHGDAANPGAFRWVAPVVIPPKAPHYGGKVVVLVDDASVSQSEYTAMAFRAAGAIIIGGTTAGADGNVSRVPLPGGLSASMSGLGVFYPDRKPTQQIGIVPDLVVRPTIQGIRDGRDEVVEAAVRHVIGQQIRVSMR